MLGKARPKMGLDVVHRRRGRTRRHDVRDQTARTGSAFASNHRRRSHARMRAQGRLHFARLDSEASDLHLVVDPTEELDIAVRAVTDEVTGAIQAGVVVGAERMAHEALRGELGPVEVAASQTCAADVQLAGDADR